ncbi:dynein axonemal light chain 4-like [Neodiprion pinetum]|uniref:Dynein light chain n=1 Tax=Neodiprion lecontei TaxID=441921 RepID=A0A6J0CCF5_NEOLC|nr:dynein axonemal light chain 4-like [Neodiprion lecontei]XP_046484173.1 dynein axonemal light chain 4-like [Neodiprion pinetum]XP_046619326.1 dynein axonemal light chain 4-like [Neodiprion virginianus]
MSAGEVMKELLQPIIHTYPLCKTTDMPEEMKQEALELCTTAAEKYADNYEHAAKMIKESLDKKFSPPFQVVVGEAYGFSVTHQEKTLLYMYTGGNLAALIWRTVTGFS